MNRITIISAMLVAALGSGSALGVEVKVRLTGAEETPPVKSMATGEGAIMVSDDGMVSGSVSTMGVEGTMGHIHQGAMGASGPVIVKLQKSGNAYQVPAGTKLTPEQLAAFRSGGLYVNIHSEANKGGELRGQIKP